MSGYVYFITDGTAIKIGHSEDVHGRRRGLQTGHHKELKILAILPGELEEEARLHARFNHLHIRGEWFKSEPDLMEFIGAIPPMTAPPEFQFRIMAEDWMAWARKKKHETAAHSYAVTGIGFWLNMLSQRVTPENLAGLREAQQIHQRLMAR